MMTSGVLSCEQIPPHTMHSLHQIARHPECKQFSLRWRFGAVSKCPPWGLSAIISQSQSHMTSLLTNHESLDRCLWRYAFITDDVTIRKRCNRWKLCKCRLSLRICLILDRLMSVCSVASCWLPQYGNQSSCHCYGISHVKERDVAPWKSISCWGCSQGTCFSLQTNKKHKHKEKEKKKSDQISFF